MKVQAAVVEAEGASEARVMLEAAVVEAAGHIKGEGDAAGGRGGS